MISYPPPFSFSWPVPSAPGRPGPPVFPFLPIAPGVCYVLAFGLYLKRELMTMSNYFNQIAIGNSGSSFQMIITSWA